MNADPAQRPPLDVARIAGGVGADAGLLVEVVAEAPSTNALVADRAREGAPDGLVVVADHQTAGRGRLDRTWETPAGAALTFSMLLRPTVPTRSWPWLPLLTGYAVARALIARGYAAGVKWPNDVLIGEGKVAGILVERVDTPEGPAAVVGVGLNTGMTAEELPVPTATSLSLEQGGSPAPDRVAVLLEVLASIRQAYDAWQLGGEPAAERLATSYAVACVTVGRAVRVDLPDGSVLEGTAEAVDSSGRLVVRTADGPREVGAGDVVHVRSVASDG
ncbi:MAG TPA: biotin--[acetyl-CoA-carboxylase] ligase [Nocardioides sp.]|nr:biotin--[acetyl-CoA-carboxylase] ligase [Nocardioides sp.]